MAGVISSREVGCVSGETLVEDEGDWLPLVEEVWVLYAIQQKLKVSKTSSRFLIGQLRQVKRKRMRQSAQFVIRD